PHGAGSGRLEIREPERGVPAVASRLQGRAGGLVPPELHPRARKIYAGRCIAHEARSMRDSSFSSALLVWILLALAPSAARARGPRGGPPGSPSAGPFSGLGGFGDFGGGFGGFWPAPPLAPVIRSPAALATPSRPDGRWKFDPNAWRRA